MLNINNTHLAVKRQVLLRGLAFLLVLALLIGFVGNIPQASAGTCDNDGVCEASAGEDKDSCPADCDKNWDPYVDPLSDKNLIATMDIIPNDKGRYACGYFDLASTSSKTGWGPKAADVTKWSDCVRHLPDLTIMCLKKDTDGNLFWVSETVANLTYDSTKQTFKWDSRQDGTCGFFPSGETALLGTASGGSGLVVLIVIVVAVLGGAGFLIVRKRQQVV